MPILQAIQSFEGGMNVYIDAAVLPQNQAVEIVNFDIRQSILTQRHTDSSQNVLGTETGLLLGLYWTDTFATNVFAIDSAKHVWFDTTDKGAITDTPTRLYQFETWKGNVYFAGGNNIFRYSGGSVTQLTAGGVPTDVNCLTRHLDRLWAGCTDGYVRWCRINDDTDWTTSSDADDAGYIKVDDSKEIVAIKSFYDVLVVFKKDATYLITGTKPSNFACVPILKTIGCVSNNGLCHAGKELYFVTASGQIYPFSAMEGYGNFTISANIAQNLVTTTLADTTHDYRTYLAHSKLYDKLYVLKYSSTSPNYDFYVYDFIATGWTRLKLYNNSDGTAASVQGVCKIDDYTAGHYILFGKTVAGENSGRTYVAGFTTTIGTKYAYLTTRKMGRETPTLKKFLFFELLPHPTANDVTYNLITETRGTETTETGLTYSYLARRGRIGKIANSAQITITPVAAVPRVQKLSHVVIYYEDTKRT